MIRAEFAFHKLNEEGQEKAIQISSAFNVLLEQLEQMVPSGGREMAIVKTKLEEACFFAKKAMATQRGNQV